MVAVQEATPHWPAWPSGGQGSAQKFSSGCGCMLLHATKPFWSAALQQICCGSGVCAGDVGAYHCLLLLQGAACHAGLTHF